MNANLLLSVLLAACLPKAPPPASPAAGLPPPPVAAPAATPEPTAPPAAAVPAPTETAGAAVATAPAAAAVPSELAAPESSAIAASDALARQVNEAVTMLTAADPERAQRAIDVLRAQLSEHPDVAAIHYNMGVAHQILGQEPEARKAWTRATEVDPTFAKAWVNLGVLNLNAGRPDLALASFQAGERYAPESTDLRVASISVLRQLKRYPEAIAEAKTALSFNSKAIAIYNELAAVYLDTAQYDLAKFTLQKAMADIDGAKNNARLHAVLGEVYYRLGFPGDSVQSFQKALSLDPFQISAMLYLAGYYLDNRAWADATPLLERAAGIAPKDPGIQLNLGISYRGEGRFEDSRRVYLDALRLAPANPEPYRNLAVLYGDYMKAYDAALQAIEDYRRAGGGPPAELDLWIASIRKEQKRVEDKARREREKRELERAELSVPAPEPTPLAPVEGGAVIPPAPDSPGEPVPSDPTTPPDDPWGGG